MSKKEYYLGLDMGTSSVGWAVTDKKYNIIRKKGKDLWGIREFEEAEVAAERRTHRINRRRNNRNKVRIGLVKGYFEEEIAKVDDTFLQRLENSKYHLEDKDEQVRYKYAIFNDENYNDVDYYKEYPTIFHLKKELIENNKAPYDIRLIYLAVLNIFKRRGHFLNASLDIESDKSDMSISNAFKNLNQILSEKFDDELLLPDISEEQMEEMKQIFTSRDYSRTKRTELIAKIINIDKKEKKKYELIRSICGLKVDYKKLFDLDDADENIDAKFSDFNYADKEPELLEKLGETLGDVLLALKQVYDSATLLGILKGEKYLSFARVEDYNQHKYDLKILKKVVKKYCPDQYDSLFREAKDGSYSAYVNSTNHKESRRRNMKNRKMEDFYSTIKKILPKETEDEDVKYILNAIDTESFMPKQLTSANGVIPNQVHARELIKILDNAAKDYQFLNEIDESGLTVKERIVRLFTFTIPYYIGPTSTDSKTGWVVRKEEGNVLPWNIEEKIDIRKTSEEFINRMVRRCTYINDEQVLPKQSLLYQKFAVLNEINNIRICNNRIDNNLKKQLYNEMYTSGKKTSRKKINQWFINNGVESETDISGIDKEMNNSLSSYGKLKSIFGEKINLDSYKEMVEDIIAKCTVYGDSKNLIIDYVKEHYPEEKYPELTKKNINKIIGFKFKDWGRFSKELLCLQGCRKETGEIYSLIDAMWDTNLNFMELINSNEFTFKEEIRNKESNALHSLYDFSPEILDEYYFSAPVKRMINQTILVIKEIEKIMGGEPERIFIEMTRRDEEKGDKGRKDSRKKQLLELYKNINDECHDKKYWSDLINKESESGRLKSKKMYLYIRQMGRDMYTGEKIDLDKLFVQNEYDIDHIYPRHFVKDDNIENNLVLVKRKANEDKSDFYPIPEKIRLNPKVQELWYTLHEMKLINDTKYARLKSNKTFTDEQRADFIARQLVETSQGTKGVADLLKQMLPNTKIVYSKASIVSDFRRNNELYKSRIVNDNHHAQDAYLNIVVGNVYFTKFTDNPLNFIKKEYKKDTKKYDYSLGRMYDNVVQRNGYVAWIPKGKGENPTIDTVNSVMNKNTPMLTRQSFEGHGGLVNQTLYGANKAKEGVYIPFKASDRKMSDVKKYGGFTNVSIAFYFLVEHEEKGRVKRTLEALPIYMKERVEKNPSELEKYCAEILKLKNYSIRLRKIRIQSLFKVNGYFAHLSGKTGNRLILRNATSMSLKSEMIEYIYFLEKYVDESKHGDKISKIKNEQLYDELMFKHTNSIYKLKPNGLGSLLEEGREKFVNLDTLEQGAVLLSILKLTSIGTSAEDLKAIGGSNLTGKMLMSKEVSKNEEILLINQSVTGFYENIIDLKTV